MGCAVVTTALVIRRELIQKPDLTTVEERPVTYVEEWRDALIAGLRIGDSDAPIQVIEFADFQCPYCAKYETTVNAVRDKYSNQIAFTFVHLPIFYHEFAEPAARAAECAYAQNKFDEMRSLLFEEQADFGSVSWTSLAEGVAIPNLDKFNNCMSEDTQPLERIAQGIDLSKRMGIRGTPTIIVNGWKWPRPPSTTEFDQIVQNVLNGKSPADGTEYRAADVG